jgi:hypothetical protein
MSGSNHFLVSRTQPDMVRFLEAELPVADDGEIVVRIDRFALTANNITYVVFGDRLRYWDFFPAPEGWGRMPVWGFADVVESRHPDVSVGERIFGFFPPSTHLSLTPDRLSVGTFTDAAPHRADLPPVYNSYTRVAADPTYDANDEGRIAVYRPLFMTSFALDDFLAEAGFFGATHVMVSSASSKTAMALAQRLQPRDIEVVGLTSPANLGFVTGLGLYDRALSYDRIGELDDDDPWTYVDFAGSAAVRSTVHHALGARLAYDCAVGGAHWNDLGGGAGLPGPRPQMFFAPDQVRRRMSEWGPAEFMDRYASAWRAFLSGHGADLELVESNGPEAVESIYRRLLGGEVPPSEGHVVDLHP